MTRPGHSRFAVPAGLGVAALLQACASPADDPRSTPIAAAAWKPAPNVRVRVVQVDFGSAASFARCAEPVCPRPTPKTVAATASAIPQPMTSFDAPSASAAPSPVNASRRVTVLFPFGSAQLTAQARADIEGALEDLRVARRIVIAGRTDSVGNGKANDALAIARASTVAGYLRVRLAGQEDALAIDAQGACCFAASNDTADGRSRNRRVEITYSRAGET
jgi:outer membrane protein OmpA-like peptidoglycan-associated protein